MSTTLSDLWLRIRAGILLSLVGFFLSLSSLVNKQPRPSFVKAYPVRRGLKHEFFLPKVYDKGKKYPLLIDIHGGGFAAGTPATDRILNQYFCDHVGVIVVSVNYRKAPKYQFPIGCKDVAAVIKSILEDKELNVDLEKVSDNTRETPSNNRSALLVIRLEEIWLLVLRCNYRHLRSKASSRYIPS